jgi:hypothetical protein
MASKDERAAKVQNFDDAMSAARKARQLAKAEAPQADDDEPDTSYDEAVLDSYIAKAGLPLAIADCGDEERALLVAMWERAESSMETEFSSFTKYGVALRVTQAYAVLYGIARAAS